jgi:uncharacterized membrane protein
MKSQGELSKGSMGQIVNAVITEKNTIHKLFDHTMPSVKLITAYKC